MCKYKYNLCKYKYKLCKYKYRPDGQPTFQASPSLFKVAPPPTPALTKIAPAGSLKSAKTEWSQLRIVSLSFSSSDPTSSPASHCHFLVSLWEKGVGGKRLESLGLHLDHDLPLSSRSPPPHTPALPALHLLFHLHQFPPILRKNLSERHLQYVQQLC